MLGAPRAVGPAREARWGLEPEPEVPNSLSYERSLTLRARLGISTGTRSMPSSTAAWYVCLSGSSGNFPSPSGEAERVSAPASSLEGTGA